MKFFRSPFAPNATFAEKAKVFALIWCQVIVVFFVLGYVITIFSDEYKYAKDFTSSNPKLLAITGADPRIILQPINYLLHKAGDFGTAHYNFSVFGEKANDSVSVYLETRSGYWAVKDAIFNSSNGQSIALTEVK